MACRSLWGCRVEHDLVTEQQYTPRVMPACLASSLILEEVSWQWLIVEIDGGDMMSSSLNF